MTTVKIVKLRRRTCNSGKNFILEVTIPKGVANDAGINVGEYVAVMSLLPYTITIRKVKGEFLSG